MKTVIVDDEPSVRETTKMFLQLYAVDIHIVGECSSVNEGYETIVRSRPDLVLLDIEMSDGTGFDLLAKFTEIPFRVIFITGHNAFAIKAFKYSAIDYLLKPLDPEEFTNALNKARKLIGTHTERERINNLLDTIRSERLPRRIVLSDSDSLYMVELDEIIRCQSEGNYTRFFLTEDREILISRTMKDFDDMFTGNRFFRSHKSHLINLSHFERFNKKEGGYIVMKDGAELPLAVRKKEALFEAMKHL